MSMRNKLNFYQPVLYYLHILKSTAGLNQVYSKYYGYYYQCQIKIRSNLMINFNIDFRKFYVNTFYSMRGNKPICKTILTSTIPSWHRLPLI